MFTCCQLYCECRDRVGSVPLRVIFITVPFQVRSITDELQSFQSGIYWLMWMPIVILMVPDVDIIFAMFVNDATPFSVNGSKCYRVQAKAEIIWLLILPNCITIYSMFELVLTLFPFFFQFHPKEQKSRARFNLSHQDWTTSFLARSGARTHPLALNGSVALHQPLVWDLSKRLIRQLSIVGM